MNPIDTVLSRLEGVRKNGNEYVAKCPSHGTDTSPSLSVKEGQDGRVLCHCFAGCRFKEIIEALGLRMRDTFNHSPSLRPVFSDRNLKRRLLHEKFILAIGDYERKNGIEPHPDDIGREDQAKVRVKQMEKELDE